MIQDFANGFATAYRDALHGDVEADGRFPSAEFAEGHAAGVRYGTSAGAMAGSFTYDRDSALAERFGSLDIQAWRSAVSA